MPKKFLFITHLTPSSKATPLRRSLNAVYKKALLSQSCSNWKALILGDHESVEGQFHSVRLEGDNREEIMNSLREVYLRNEVKNLISGADYVIKLDDDDVISRSLLSSVENLDFDCYYDEWHTFYDLTTGAITQQKRKWFASTCIHRAEYVLAHYDGIGSTSLNNLLYSDHSKAWHRFYSGKKVVIAKKNNPVYLRVLSPTSITAGEMAGRLDEEGLIKYRHYLKQFGDWNESEVTGFEHMIADLESVWVEFSGEPLPPVRPTKRNFINRQLAKIFYGKRT